MSDLRAIAAGLVLAAAIALPGRADLPGAPVEQWRWDGDVRDPVRNFPLGTPVVVQLTDDDGDTVIDASDSPDVAFLHWGFGFLENAALTALHGDTGQEIFTVTDPPFSVFNANGSALAAGDLDGDGVVELVVSSTTFGERAAERIVFAHDGTLFDRRPWPQAMSGNGPAIGIADLDQDGVAETYMRAMVMSIDGTLSWAGTAPTTWTSSSQFAQVADIRPDVPGLELVSGNKCYSATGAVLWENTALPSGGTALGDLDGDTVPEIVLTARDQPFVWVLDPRGALVAPPFPLGPNSMNETQPVLADLDGDGLPEVVVPAGLTLHALDWQPGGLVPLWEVPYEDGSCCSDATAFDFDGDGSSEIVYRDQVDWGIRNGCDGTLLHAEPSVSCTAMESPVVANIDLDPAAEVVVLGLQFVGANLNAVVAYEVPGSATPRSIWNQKTYHVTNVGDDGSVPRVEVPPWVSHRSWHAQLGEGGASPLAFDAAAARDLFNCNLGIEVTWDPAVAAGAVTYDVHRSEDQARPTCADALARPPIAAGLTGTSWIDAGTLPFARHAYVVRARLASSCADFAADACTEPAVTDVADRPPPGGVFAVLRASHAGDEVTMSWLRARALVAGEHFHLLRALGLPTAAFSLVNPEADLALAHVETDLASPLQFFDLRVANECEVISADEYPPGRDWP